MWLVVPDLSAVLRADPSFLPWLHQCTRASAICLRETMQKLQAALDQLPPDDNKTLKPTITIQMPGDAFVVPGHSAAIVIAIGAHLASLSFNFSYTHSGLCDSLESVVSARPLQVNSVFGTGVHFPCGSVLSMFEHDPREFGRRWPKLALGLAAINTLKGVCERQGWKIVHWRQQKQTMHCGGSDTPAHGWCGKQILGFGVLINDRISGLACTIESNWALFAPSLSMLLLSGSSATGTAASPWCVLHHLLCQSCTLFNVGVLLQCWSDRIHSSPPVTSAAQSNNQPMEDQAAKSSPPPRSLRHDRSQPVAPDDLPAVFRPFVRSVAPLAFPPRPVLSTSVMQTICSDDAMAAAIEQGEPIHLKMPEGADAIQELDQGQHAHKHTHTHTPAALLSFSS